MELKEIKCKNCGASLEIEERQKKVTCEYCHSKFSVEDEYSKAYDRTKGQMDAMNEAFDKSGIRKASSSFLKVHFLITGLMIFIFVLGFGITLYSFVSTIVGKDEVTPDVTIPTTEFTGVSQYDIDSFNHKFEVYAGRHNAGFVVFLLNDTVTNNKTNTHIITVSNGTIEGSDEATINQIRDSLDHFNDYNVSFDYDSDGFIYKCSVTIIS